MQALGGTSCTPNMCYSQQVVNANSSWLSTFMWLWCRFGGFCDNVDSFDAELFRFSPTEAVSNGPSTARPHAADAAGAV